MTTAQPDPEEVGGTYGSREVAAAWRRSGAARAEALGPATELMLELAGLRPGSRVLDVAAGTGEQSLLAARMVGPEGSVLATDIAAPMLELAAEAAREAGLANVETSVMDAQRLELDADSFDAAISRSGLMLMPDPRRALAEVRRVLKPGARLAVIVFSTADKNPYAARPREIARRCGRLPAPAPGAPDMFALGAPGALEDAFGRAGFRAVAVRAVPTVRRFGSVDEALRNYRESFPSLHELMAPLSDAEREQAWAEIERELRERAGPDGFEIAGEVLVGSGTK